MKFKLNDDLHQNFQKYVESVKALQSIEVHASHQKFLVLENFNVTFHFYIKTLLQSWHEKIWFKMRKESEKGLDPKFNKS